MHNYAHTCRSCASDMNLHFISYTLWQLLDIDECANGNNDCQQRCVNTEGSFICQCFMGFELVDTTHCRGMIFFQAI